MVICRAAYDYFHSPVLLFSVIQQLYIYLTYNDVKLSPLQPSETAFLSF